LEWAVLAGPGRSIRVAWSRDEDPLSEILTRGGTVAGPFGRRSRLGAGDAYWPFTGWIDAHGRAILVAHGPLRGSHPRYEGSELVAAIAPFDKPFGPVRHIASGAPNCALNEGEEEELEPIATSRDGRAVLLLTCTDASFRPRGQYVIRYTP
jgi:hypothetical protein